MPRRSAGYLAGDEVIEAAAGKRMRRKMEIPGEGRTIASATSPRAAGLRPADRWNARRVFLFFSFSSEASDGSIKLRPICQKKRRPNNKR
jgi:hypothetical protein